jgi:hypothetical protein
MELYSSAIIRAWVSMCRLMLHKAVEKASLNNQESTVIIQSALPSTANMKQTVTTNNVMKK